MPVALAVAPATFANVHLINRYALTDQRAPALLLTAACPVPRPWQPCIQTADQRHP